MFAGVPLRERGTKDRNCAFGWKRYGCSSKLAGSPTKKPFVRYKLCKGHLMRWVKLEERFVVSLLRPGRRFDFWVKKRTQCTVFIHFFWEHFMPILHSPSVLHCLRSPNPNEAFEPWCLKDPIVACVPWWSLTHLGKLSIWIRHLRCKKRWVEEVKVLLTQVTSLIQILQWLDSKFWRLGLVKCINLSRTLKSKR